MFAQTVPSFVEVHYALPPQATFMAQDQPTTATPSEAARASQAARETMGRACPHLSPEEVELKCYELHYGRARAEQLRCDMRRRRSWSEGYGVASGR